jgi:protein TonB
VTHRSWLVVLVGAVACTAPGPRADEAPHVAGNGEARVQYPPQLFDQGVEGDVMLRLFVDSTGRLRPESSRVAASSGSPTLDSAALSGVAQLHYAPARRGGAPVAATFLQPVEFHRPHGAPDAPAR